MLSVEEKNLVDISEIRIDQTLSKEERIKKFIADVGNPYEFKVGDIEVAVSFEEDGETMQQKMEKYFESMII